MSSSRGDIRAFVPEEESFNELNDLNGIEGVSVVAKVPQARDAVRTSSRDATRGPELGAAAIPIAMTIGKAAWNHREAIISTLQRHFKVGGGKIGIKFGDWSADIVSMPDITTVFKTGWAKLGLGAEKETAESEDKMYANPETHQKIESGIAYIDGLASLSEEAKDRLKEKIVAKELGL